MKKMKKERSREEIEDIRAKLDLGIAASFLTLIFFLFADGSVLYPHCLVPLFALVCIFPFRYYFGDPSIQRRRRKQRKREGHWR